MRRGRVRGPQRDRVAGAPGRFSALGGGVRLLGAVEQAGLPLALVHRLRDRLRVCQGRNPQPTACIVDSQIVKCADTVPKATRGYHGGKKITGRGRHLAVDAEGWLLALVVTAASVSDKAGAKLLVIRFFDAFTPLRIILPDRRYHAH